MNEDAGRFADVFAPFTPTIRADGGGGAENTPSFCISSPAFAWADSRPGDGRASAGEQHGAVAAGDLGQRIAVVCRSHHPSDGKALIGARRRSKYARVPAPL